MDIRGSSHPPLLGFVLSGVHPIPSKLFQTLCGPRRANRPHITNTMMAPPLPIQPEGRVSKSRHEVQRRVSEAALVNPLADPSGRNGTFALFSTPSAFKNESEGNCRRGGSR